MDYVLFLEDKSTSCYRDKMSRIDYKSQKTDKNKATKLLREIVNKRPNNIGFSQHSQKEMLKDNLSTNDVLNILYSTYSRILKDGELENGSYRYQYGTGKIVVVVAFWPDGKGLNIVTVWRK